MPYVHKLASVAFQHLFAILMILAVAACSNEAGFPDAQDGVDAFDDGDSGDIHDGSDNGDPNGGGEGDFVCNPSVELDVPPSDDTDRILLEASVFLGDGIKAGIGETVTFSADLGRFLESGSLNYESFTDESGVASVTFLHAVGQVQGVATVQASVFICDISASDQVEVIVRPVGFIEFVSAVPEGDSIVVTFATKDSEGNPWTDSLVEFTHSGGPGVTLDPLTDVTDVNGEAQTTLDKGTVTTPLVVTATATFGTQTNQAVSPPL